MPGKPVTLTVSKPQSDLSNPYDSVLLNHQANLLANLSSTIQLKFVDNGKAVVASNITEEEFERIPMVTNDPAHHALLHVDDILVHQGSSTAHPTLVNGFRDNLLQKIAKEDSIAYSNNEKTYTPFVKGVHNAINVNTLCDQLSELGTVKTTNTQKFYTMYIGNRKRRGWPHWDRSEIGESAAEGGLDALFAVGEL